MLSNPMFSDLSSRPIHQFDSPCQLQSLSGLRTITPPPSRFSLAIYRFSFPTHRPLCSTEINPHIGRIHRPHSSLPVFRSALIPSALRYPSYPNLHILHPALAKTYRASGEKVWTRNTITTNIDISSKSEITLKDLCFTGQMESMD